MTHDPTARRLRSPGIIRLLTAGALAASLGALPLLPQASPAQAKEVAAASSSYLCTGYDGCARAGYGHAGYKERGGSMYWNMYSGHNCTNYAAYRIVQAGGPATRPWSGSGNAVNWGLANAGKTDRTPEVGAIAWFRANRPGVSGSAGHVAYVERIVSPTEIIVSEDLWGGDFHWRRYSVAAGTWPDGFIHFVKPAAPAPVELKMTTRPAVSGESRVGSRLVSTRGAYQPRVKEVKRQWRVGGVAVSGATGRAFVPRPQDLGKRVTVAVTVGRPGYKPTTTTTGLKGSVRPGLFTTTQPTIIGDPVVGQKLTANPASTTPSPARRSFQWWAAGKPLAGETSQTLQLEQALLGSTVAVRVSVSAPGYRTAVRRSVATSPVSEPPEVTVVAPAAVTGLLRVGETLAVEPGEFQPSQAQVSYRWLRNGAPVVRGRSSTYEIRPRDVGGKLSVRMSAASPGMTSVDQLIELPQAVRTAPALTVAASGSSRKAVVELRVSAPGVESPSGAVRVRVGARRVTGTLTNGYGLFTVGGLRAGEKVVVAKFLGTEVIESASTATKVRVLR